MSQTCFRWDNGQGCNTTECTRVHDKAKDYLNECHRFQRGQPCHRDPCYKLHVIPAAASSSSPSNPPPSPPLHNDVVLETIKQALDNKDAVRADTARRLLQLFHPDKTAIFGEPLTALFADTVRFLTNEIRQS